MTLTTTTKIVKFDINYKNAKVQGIKVGAYIYNYCNTTDAVNKGTEWALEQLGGKKLIYQSILIWKTKIYKEKQ